MAKVIIFGIQDFAELAHFYLTNDSEHEVVAFSVNEVFLPKIPIFCNLPVIPFEKVTTIYPPSGFSFFAPMAPKKMNKTREAVYNTITAKGYSMVSYISSKATIFNNTIGRNCFILEDNTLQPFTDIGNNVILWSGNHIGHHGQIKDHVMFTSHVVLSGHCLVENNCFLGVNSTIRDGIHLGAGTLVAMGASITKNTEPWSAYIGNPGKKIAGKTSDELM